MLGKLQQTEELSRHILHRRPWFWFQKLKKNNFWQANGIQFTVHKGVPAPPPLFLRHPPLDPACLLPFLNFWFPLPSFLFHPLLRYFTKFSPPLRNPLLPQSNQPTFLWFKQISKGWFYQLNCHFLSKAKF